MLLINSIFTCRAQKILVSAKNLLLYLKLETVWGLRKVKGQTREGQKEQIPRGFGLRERPEQRQGGLGWVSGKGKRGGRALSQAVQSSRSAGTEVSDTGGDFGVSGWDFGMSR